MSVKKIVYFSLLTLFSLSIIYFIYFKYTKKTDITEIELNKTDEEVIYKSNIIKVLRRLASVAKSLLNTIARTKSLLKVI